MLNYLKEMVRKLMQIYKTGYELLNRLKTIPKIIENCELQKQHWELKATNSTAGGVTVTLFNKKCEEELHNMEKVKASSCSDPVGVAVTNYVDLERKIIALKAEKKEAESILEQLNPNEYDVLYKFFILEFRNYEIADDLNKSESYIEKTKNKALKKLQNILDFTE